MKMFISDQIGNYFEMSPEFMIAEDAAFSADEYLDCFASDCVAMFMGH